LLRVEVEVEGEGWKIEEWKGLDPDGLGAGALSNLGLFLWHSFSTCSAFT
jgi:hypothetical protein